MKLFDWLIRYYHEAHGARAYQQGRLADAEARFRKSWALAESLPATSKARARVLGWLTRATRNQGNFDDAESFGRDWIRTAEQANGGEHPRTLQAMEYLAEIYTAIARYHLALPLLERALAVREKQRNAEPLEFAKALESLAHLWGCQERDDKSEPYLRQAFNIAQSLPDEATAEKLTIATKLSTVLVHQERLTEAEELAQNALALAESKSRASMPIAYCLQQLAYVRRFQERFAEAEELLRRSMAMVRQEVPTVEMALHGHHHLLGVILRYQSRWAEAEESFRETLRLRQAYCAPEDLAIARVLEDYAELLELMGRNEDATAHQRWARHIREFHAPFRVS